MKEVRIVVGTQGYDFDCVAKVGKQALLLWVFMRWKFMFIQQFKKTKHPYLKRPNKKGSRKTKREGIKLTVKHYLKSAPT